MSADTTLLSQGLVETSVGAAGVVWRDGDDLGLKFVVGMIKD